MRQRLLTLALFSLFLFALPAFPISGEFMAADELSRGMRGVGRTVFQGTSIDSFAVEILGVVHSGLGPRQDLILARLSGGPLAETGIIKGMSGSPVYVEGRLIGAVAYGWTFSKQPICGITPIHQMLRVMERDMGPPPAGSRAHFPLELDADAAALVREAIPDGELPDAVSLEPLATPVWVAGMTPLAGSILGEILRPFGLQVMAAPGGREEIGAEPLLEPGSPLGVQLISGDLSAGKKEGYPKGPITPGGTIPRLLRQYPGLNCDISAGSGFNALTRDPDFTWGFISEFQDRILLGLDATDVELDFQHIEWLQQACADGNITADVLQKILWRNANRLIGLGLEV